MSMSAAEAAETFRKLAARWCLNDAQAAALLGVTEEDLRLSDGAGLSADAVERIVHLAAIARALNTLYSHHLADGWMLRPLAGPTSDWPLDLLTEGGLPTFVAMRADLEARL